MFSIHIRNYLKLVLSGFEVQQTMMDYVVQDTVWKTIQETNVLW